MPSIEEILQFHFLPNTLKQSAKNIISINLNTLNDHRIDKLHKINEVIGISSFAFTGSSLIPQVFKKFKTSIKTPNIKFDRRELRTLTYSLSYSEQWLSSIFSNENELKNVLTLLESNWKDSFLMGLIDCFLRNWETNHLDSFELLEQFISHKLDTYIGNRSVLISYKKNKRFFNTKNGNLILGDTLAKLGKPIMEASKMLSVPESWMAYPYFSKAIVTYYERNKRKIAVTLDYYIEVLNQHNSSVTNKRLISKIIIQANLPQYSGIKDKVKSIAFKKIGDPGNISNWTVFDNATEAEKIELTNARSILNEWITQQFINVFFNVCINDERRKKFWLKFSAKISSFKVYGPLQTKTILKGDARIAEYVDARFEGVRSRSSVSAFILYIGEYMLIEFSHEGYAFYAYKIDSVNRPDLNSQLNSVDDLRNGSMPMALQSDAYYEYYNDEGRLTHRDGTQIWETKFNSWMNEKVFK